MAGRNQCVRRGTCLTGCPERAKASTDHTHWPSALAARRHSDYRCPRAGDHGKRAKGLATGAIYIDRNGREREQACARWSLSVPTASVRRACCCSRSQRKFPDGLANSSGLVGKNLMMHPYAAVTGYFDEPLESWLGSGRTDHPVDAILRDGRNARLRARRQVASDAERRAAWHARSLWRQAA